MAQAYVYGILDEGIVVLEREEAEYLARIWRASRQAKTWGEFRGLLEERALQELQERYQWFGPDDVVIEDNSPADDVPFLSIKGSVDGWGDSGGWPEWPSARMRYALPEAVRERVGRASTSMASGDSYSIEPHEQEELIATFRDLGLALSRNDALLEEACGY